MAPGIPSAVTAGGHTVAVRAPAHPVALALIEACGCAIAAPSANMSGEPPPTTAAMVVKSLGGRIRLVVDGGETTVQTPSTLVSLEEGKARILREGAVSAQEIQEVLRLARAGVGS
jgi:L-threonylcarbamoyladenylate synthase